MKKIVFVIKNKGKGNTADAQEVFVVSDNTQDNGGGSGITNITEADGVTVTDDGSGGKVVGLGNITPDSVVTDNVTVENGISAAIVNFDNIENNNGNAGITNDGIIYGVEANILNLYNKTETDTLLADKINIADAILTVAGLSRDGSGNIPVADLRTALGVSTDVTKDLVSDHTDKVSTTGITTQQVLSSVAIGQATGIRTIKPDSFLNVRTRFSKSANQNAADIKFYISTVAGTPGGTLPAQAVHIGRYNMSAATLNVSGWQREYNINASSLLEGMNANLSGLTDIMIGNSNPIAVQLSLPQQYYFITTVEMASPAVETLTQKSIHITSSK